MHVMPCGRKNCQTLPKLRKFKSILHVIEKYINIFFSLQRGSASDFVAVVHPFGDQED